MSPRRVRFACLFAATALAACGAAPSGAGIRAAETASPAQRPPSAAAVLTVLEPPGCGARCAHLARLARAAALPTQRLTADADRFPDPRWQALCAEVKRSSAPVAWLGHLRLRRHDRAELDSLLARFTRWPAPEALLEPADPGGRLLMYTAPWCKPCVAAKAWFDARGVLLRRKDIARNQLWKLELEALLCARFGECSATSMPVFVHGDDVLRGFDREALERLDPALAADGAPPSPE